MRTLIISDLHLGSATGVDVLRRSEPRAALLRELRTVDRLVLLGDLLELRHGPRREALAIARPFFQELGRALEDREIIVVAGNHDHALVEPWLQGRSELERPAPLAAEQCLDAAEASPMAARLAAWAGRARVSVAYPGLWVRRDVYATHGHFLDCHLTIPTIERVGIGAMGRLLGLSSSQAATVEDYERLTGPVFAWIDAIASQASTGDALNGGMTVRAWRALRASEDRPAAPGERGAAGRRRLGPLPRKLRRRILAGAFPLAIAALNRAGLGPLRADLSSRELRRAGLRAIGEVAAGLRLGDAYVVFGHTHRAGPLPGDSVGEWRAPSGARLVNCGCWTYDAHFMDGAPSDSPYWPGSCVLVEDDGAPVLRRLLSATSPVAPLPAAFEPAPADEGC